MKTIVLLIMISMSFGAFAATPAEQSKMEIRAVLALAASTFGEESRVIEIVNRVTEYYVADGSNPQKEEIFSLKLITEKINSPLAIHSCKDREPGPFGESLPANLQLQCEIIRPVEKMFKDESNGQKIVTRIGVENEFAYEDGEEFEYQVSIMDIKSYYKNKR